MTNDPLLEREQNRIAFWLRDGLTVLQEVQGYISPLSDPECLPEDGTVSNATVATYSFALIKEVTELADELNWKPWKNPKAITAREIAMEFADILAFVGLLSVIITRKTGLTPTALANAYVDKSIINEQRALTRKDAADAERANELRKASVG